jgi:hypothetical protein
MVTPMDDNLRTDIASACAEHDRLMANAVEAEGRRNVARTLLARGTGPAGILYAATIDNAPACPPQVDDGALFGDARDEMLAENIGDLLLHERKLARSERRAERACDQRACDARVAKFQVDMNRLCGTINRAIGEAIDTTVKELLHRERVVFERKLEILAAENVELRALLGDALKQFAQAGDRTKALAGEIERGHRDSDGIIAEFGSQLAHLRGLVEGRLNQLATVADSAGLLPRGW